VTAGPARGQSSAGYQVTPIRAGTADRPVPADRFGAVPDLPWTARAEMEPGTGYLVMASHLPLQRITATVRFFRAVSAVRKQLASAEGLVGYTLRAKPLARDYWTLSVWNDAAALRQFMRTAPHVQVMTSLKPFMGPAKFVTWTVSQPTAVRAWQPPWSTWPPGSACSWPVLAGQPRQLWRVSWPAMAADQRTRAAGSARNTGRVQRDRRTCLSADRANRIAIDKCQTAAVGTGVLALLRAPGYHLRRELFDVVAGAQLGDRRVKRPCGAGDQLRELLLVVLMAGWGDQEDHTGWAGPGVGEGVRAAARDIHHASRPAAGDPGAGVRLPVLPVAGRSDARFEGEQVELALQDVEQLFGVAVQVRADVKSRPDINNLEHRPDLGLRIADLQRHRQ
jgi:hypothetical protein